MPSHRTDGPWFIPQPPNDLKSPWANGVSAWSEGRRQAELDHALAERDAEVRSLVAALSDEHIASVKSPRKALADLRDQLRGMVGDA